MITQTAAEAYLKDLALWYKEKFSQREHIKKLRRIEENLAMQEDNYARPLKEIKCKSTWSIIDLLKYLIP